ncbi:hypothetical protein W97_07831 [Coniosporium apollinis CBS 100218]|uniref:Rhodopsin domain-containing protein n=1 Tax=Coniosporium apollinis (strain CBS 100218) TaxID=1168221 RepID=R7Z3A1_CONA1|nr:uncharacterized protein W97_07831 [Coniosporium apollinis CBS 100218]EON68573.1 hypothetical protein W97_07831 [Coniosporium apollinis CBS 100218]
MIVPRGLFGDAPPEPRSRLANNPTLLFSWWCTGMALTTILVRLMGRLVRNDRLFREDKLMALSIIPLLLRMAFIHPVLLFGTNNVATDSLSAEQIYTHSIGARLVLGARIFYALFIWTAKFTVSEFLKRLTCRFWKRGYEVGLRSIRIFLVVTFFMVVIATLAECQPFDHYWQVVPDPGPRCRSGYAHLITMGVADIITDVLLIVFPIPIIIKSAMPMARKVALVLLFAMSLILIAVTGARVPLVIQHQGRQQYRTVFASGEILAATAVSNAVVLGSFLRDRGVKKAKFKTVSRTDSMERGSRRETIAVQQWGSDEDLIRDLPGYQLDPELHRTQSGPRRPSVAVSTDTMMSGANTVPSGKQGWKSLDTTAESCRSSEGSEETETDLKSPITPGPMPKPQEVRVVHPKQNMAFFDYGGLLDTSPASASTMASPTGDATSAQDFASPRRGSRRGDRGIFLCLKAILMS